LTWVIAGESAQLERNAVGELRVEVSRDVSAGSALARRRATRSSLSDLGGAYSKKREITKTSFLRYADSTWRQT
jgi:hypothetical protein